MKFSVKTAEIYHLKEIVTFRKHNLWYLSYASTDNFLPGLPMLSLIILPRRIKTILFIYTVDQMRNL